MNQDIYLPLHQKQSWDEANQSIHFLLEKYKSDSVPIRKLAFEISNLFVEIFPVLSGLCAKTCPFCPDPCCLKAKVWFDLKDMLFLHLNGIEIPESQPLGKPDDICRYLGPKGCRLERMSRPFICTWYLCPPQMSLLHKDQQNKQCFDNAIQSIKSIRKEIECIFIEITNAI